MYRGVGHARSCARDECILLYVSCVDRRLTRSGRVERRRKSVTESLLRTPLPETMGRVKSHPRLAARVNHDVPPHCTSAGARAPQRARHDVSRDRGAGAMSSKIGKRQVRAWTLSRSRLPRASSRRLRSTATVPSQTLSAARVAGALRVMRRRASPRIEGRRSLDARPTTPRVVASSSRPSRLTHPDRPPSPLATRPRVVRAHPQQKRGRFDASGTVTSPAFRRKLEALPNSSVGFSDAPRIFGDSTRRFRGCRRRVQGARWRSSACEAPRTSTGR